MFVSGMTPVYPVWAFPSLLQMGVIRSCNATCKRRFARSKLPFEPAIFVRPAIPDAEGVMTDATVGVGSHQGRYSTSNYGVQVRDRSVDVSHWHSKPLSLFAPSRIQVAPTRTREG